MTAREAMGSAGRAAASLALRRWPGGWLAAAALLAVAGCAGTSGPGGSAALPADQPNAIPTASDQSDADRRSRVRLELAGAYFSRGQFDTALDEVKLALVANPNSADAFNLRGLIYGAIGEDGLAEDSFRRALQINPRDGGTLHNMGWFHCQRNRFAEAQAQFAAALALQQYRDPARTWLASGLCHGRNRQWAEAEAALMRAFELDPGNPSTGFTLAEVLYQQHDYERARFYIGRVNDVADTANAQSLWLAARIEHRLGSFKGERQFGNRLRERFPQSAEAMKYDTGRFDD